MIWAIARCAQVCIFVMLPQLWQVKGLDDTLLMTGILAICEPLYVAALPS